MIINNVIFNDNLDTMLIELRNQLRLNNIPLLEKEPRRSGNSLQIQCPYHGDGLERRPSAGIRESDGMFHCFACNEIHTLPEVISHCFGHDDMGIFGWQWLLKNFFALEVEDRKPLNISFNRYATHEKEAVNYVSEEELDKYRYIHSYMYKRGLTDEVIEIFDIGYDKNTRCITFPVRDKSGGTLFIARRSVNSKYFNYPKEAEKPLYGLYELYQQRSFPSAVIVCESMLDALSFWTVKRFAVALNGLGNELQFAQLRELPCRKLILATDNDSAGSKARIRIRKNVRNKIITEYMFPADRKDANECSKEELLNLVEIF